MALEQMEGFELAGRTVSITPQRYGSLVDFHIVAGQHCSRERNSQVYPAGLFG